MPTADTTFGLVHVVPSGSGAPGFAYAGTAELTDQAAMDGEEGEVSSPDTSHHHQPSCQLLWCHCHCQLGPLGTSVINLVQWVGITTLDLLVRCSPQVIVQRSVHRKLGPAAQWLTASAPARHTLLPATVISALAAWCLRPFCSCRCPGQLPLSAQCHVCHLHHIGARQTAAALVAPMAGNAVLLSQGHQAYEPSLLATAAT